MPTVDFILPIKSPAPYLGRTLESINAQTMEEWALVAVLDGYSSQTEGFLRERVSSSRLTIIQRPQPQGIVAALNSALERSSAPYCARIDADDLCEPMRLSRQMDFLARNPAVALVGSSASLVDDEGYRLGTLAANTTDIPSRLTWRNQFVHSSVIFNREKICALGGYDARADRREDYHLWMRVAALHPVSNLDEALVQYRISPGQASALPVSHHALGAISQARRLLGESLGLSRPQILIRDRAWRMAQSPRYRNFLGRLARRS